LPTSLFKKLLDRKPFQKRLERKPQAMFEFEILSSNPIGVINRRNGFGATVLIKQRDGSFEFENFIPSLAGMVNYCAR